MVYERNLQMQGCLLDPILCSPTSQHSWSSPWESLRYQSGTSRGNHTLHVSPNSNQQLFQCLSQVVIHTFPGFLTTSNHPALSLAGRCSRDVWGERGGLSQDNWPMDLQNVRGDGCRADFKTNIPPNRMFSLGDRFSPVCHIPGPFICVLTSHWKSFISEKSQVLLGPMLHSVTDKSHTE